jgi:2-oxoglutarate ferredoxin oxidoreductase subunit alpha
MTSSSSTGISLMQEGLSYLASAELPAVIVNVSRGGPGLGRICPSQADYFQATKGGGHGDYHLIVLAPSSVQEMADLMFLAFDLADRYRNPVMILADGILGQMMESVVIGEPLESVPPRPWAVRGRGDGLRNVIISAPYTDADLRAMNLRLRDKYRRLAEAECRHELHRAEEVEHLVVAFGTAARFAMEAVDSLRDDGFRVGLLRPVTLFPFPYDAFEKLTRSLKSVLVVEMNEGQMIEDVKLGLCAAGFRGPVGSFGGGGGFIPSPADIEREVLCLAGMGAVA